MKNDGLKKTRKNIEVQTDEPQRFHPSKSFTLNYQRHLSGKEKGGRHRTGRQEERPQSKENEKEAHAAVGTRVYGSACRIYGRPLPG